MNLAVRKRGGQVIPLTQRLERLSMLLTECGCQIWLGELNDTGYGLIRISGKIKMAHRISWTESMGPIPEGMKVLHRCDVRCCIRPDHLFIGTQADNVQDMLKKGRGALAAGEFNGRAKLSEVQALQILQSSLGCAELARQFGISASMASAIKLGKNWRHL